MPGGATSQPGRKEQAGDPVSDLSQGTWSLRPEVLIVCDDDLARSALRDAAIACRLFGSRHVMTDGRFALEYLWLCLHEPQRRIPDVVVAGPTIAGLSLAAFLREVRRYEELNGVFLAVHAPDAAWEWQDYLQSAGCDHVIRTSADSGRFPHEFRALAYYAIGAGDAPELAATRLWCGSLSGSGMDVPLMD